MPHSVLITGASTGIGLACALRMERRGWRVLAGVRSAADAERLRGLGSGRLEPVMVDVTDPGSVRAACERVSAAVGDAGLDGLVNNAGIAHLAPMEFLDLDDLRRLLEVNVVGLLGVTQQALSMLRRARGRVVNVGSIAGHVASPFVGAYSITKHAVEALTDALRLEVAHLGVGVSVIEPGMIATPIWEKGEAAAAAQRAALPPAAEEAYGPLMDAFARLIRPAIARAPSPEIVADAVEHALADPGPRTRYVVGRDARIRLLMKRLLPDRLMDRLVHAALRRHV